MGKYGKYTGSPQRTIDARCADHFDMPEHEIIKKVESIIADIPVMKARYDVTFDPKIIFSLGLEMGFAQALMTMKPLYSVPGIKLKHKLDDLELEVQKWIG